MDPKFEPVMSGQPTRPRNPVFDGTVVPPLAQNNVLRNTYWLLALSMLPTVAGALYPFGPRRGLRGRSIACGPGPRSSERERS